nr:hypothetical protein [Thermomonospora amylolytica]
MTTTTRVRSTQRVTSTVTDAPGACLAAFVSASCTTRYTVPSTSGGAGSTAFPRRSKATGMPDAAARSTSSRSAAGPPPGRSGAGSASSRSTPMISCSRWVAVAAASRTRAAAARCRSSRSAASSSAPARNAIRLSSCPSESCMSWAIRDRSRSRSRSATIRCSRSSCSARCHPARTSAVYCRHARPASHGSTPSSTSHTVSGNHTVTGTPRTTLSAAPPPQISVNAHTTGRARSERRPTR